MKNNQKGFAKNLVLIGVVSLLVVVGGYLMWKKNRSVIIIDPAPTHEQIFQYETANWQTYTNEKYGFGFKHPVGLVMSEESSKSGVSFSSEDFSFSLLINNPGVGFGEGENDISETSIIVDGVKAQKSVFGEFGSGKKSVFYSFSKNGNSYLVSSHGAYEKADQILTTFKFTKPVKQAGSSNLSECLPSGIKLDDVASISGYTANNQPIKVTVKQKLTELHAKCDNGKLVDSSNKEISFYYLTGCWGNPPADYHELVQQENDKINKLKETYTVIEMTCNPSGIPIQ